MFGDSAITRFAPLPTEADRVARTSRTNSPSPRRNVPSTLLDRVFKRVVTLLARVVRASPTAYRRGRSFRAARRQSPRMLRSSIHSTQAVRAPSLCEYPHRQPASSGAARDNSATDDRGPGGRRRRPGGAPGRGPPGAARPTGAFGGGGHGRKRHREPLAQGRPQAPRAFAALVAGFAGPAVLVAFVVLGPRSRWRTGRHGCSSAASWVRWGCSRSSTSCRPEHVVAPSLLPAATVHGLRAEAGRR